MDVNDLDLNWAYAAHQRALMIAGMASSEDSRRDSLETASRIASRIRRFQLELGAEAARDWKTTTGAQPVPAQIESASVTRAPN